MRGLTATTAPARATRAEGFGGALAVIYAHGLTLGVHGLDEYGGDGINVYQRFGWVGVGGMVIVLLLAMRSMNKMLALLGINDGKYSTLLQTFKHFSLRGSLLREGILHVISCVGNCLSERGLEAL